jgi:NOL1/NOP2/sun family putative RNA methylase
MESNLPDFLIEMLKNQYEESIVNKIIEGYKAERKVTLRVNRVKSSSEKVKEELEKKYIKFTEVPWSKDALIIENVRENVIQDLSIYENGEIYLQSLSSMLPPIILDPKEGEDILDMTAAPGGKTTQMASISNNKAHITACEMNNVRIEKLKYNIEKQGASCVYIMQKDSRKIDDFFSFDKILLDAPCSGSGTLNVNDKNIEKYFTPKLIEKSVASQVTLLKKAIRILKQGNCMVYSTCSILDKENEEVLKKVLAETKTEIVPIEFEGKENVPCLPVKIDGTMCVCPTENFEGFFVAKIRKIK